MTLRLSLQFCSEWRATSANNYEPRLVCADAAGAGRAGPLRYPASAA